MNKKSIILLLTLLLSFFVLVQSPIYASPPPSEVEEIKNNSPLQVIGEVKDDILIQDMTKVRDYPSQLRKMEIEISSIIKKPNDLPLVAGESLELHYTYIPSWVSMDGGAKMDIMVGDIIEIWLEKGKNGWEPALGGNTVNHHKYMEPRKEPIPEPIAQGILSYLGDHDSLTVILGLFFLSILIVMIARKSARSHKQ